MTAVAAPGRDAAARHGWWTAHRFLLLRRATQLGFLAIFLAGPLLGVWIVKGTYASSLTLEVLPLTDPLIVLQSIVAGHMPETTALTGAATVLAAYLLLGGRTFCSWACPINPVTDLAAYLRRRLDVDKGWGTMGRATRWWVLGFVLAASAATGTIAWELVNPITTLWRAMLYGVGLGAAGVVAIFAFDLVVVRHGWCGHLCPVGAFYGLLGKVTPLRVAAPGRARCNDCLECFTVCPEQHVIAPALRGEKIGRGPVIASGDCTVCGRCIDVCPERVFRLTHRFDRRLDAGPALAAPHAPDPMNPARFADGELR
jgi:ferredoxin-type protein NapH